MVRPKAELDLRRASSWYESQREGLGRVFENHVVALLRSLESNALIYAQGIDRSRCAFLRRFPYAVTYQLRGEEVIVISIMHTKQQRDR